MDEKKLKIILKKHKDWLYDKKNGERANLWNADLQDADLRNANLQNADLQDADLQDADLQNANLRNADLRDANLWNANLRDANLRYANLRYANLRDADLRDANLWNANLWNANLWNANLRDADLSDADLRDADLRDADLIGANLSDAKGIWMYYRSSLNILKYQKGKLRAFKYLNGNHSPYQKTVYRVGKTYSVDDFDTDIFNLCGSGINVASLEWCLQDTNFDLDKTYVEVEFDASDIVCIPFASDGKFRVRKIKVLRKLTKKEIKDEFKLKIQGK
jgi:hypothetical protein